MSKTVAQIFAANPTTVVADTDLYYLVQSPYTPGTDAAISGASLKAVFGSGGTVNPGLINQLAFYAASGSAISGLATLANGTLITSAGGVPSISQTLPNAVQDNITRLGTISNIGSPLGGTFGGTGTNNGASTITIGGSVTFSGAFTFTGTLTGNTSVTFPTSGTLATTSQLPTPAALTKTDDTNVTLTLGGTPATALLQATSLTLGWTGTLSGTRGGTGVNNGANTITLGGNISTASSFTTSGAFAVTQTYTGITNVTFPTSGTLATTSQIPTGAALTKTDDTNVTLTLGGSPTTALVNAASLTLGWTGQLGLTRGGTNASLTASNGGIVWSNASQLQILSGTATARQMLQSGANVTPAWSTATWPATTTANAVLFSSATNTVSEIASAASATLITSAGSVPSFSQTLPSAVQTNITALGAQSQALNMNTHQINNLTAGVAATDAANVGQVTAASSPLTTKGDIYTFTTVNARLPVATGDGKILQVSSAATTGLAYSTPTYPSASGASGAVLISDATNYIASTSLWPNTVGTSGKVVISNGTSNVYSTPTFPNASATTRKIIVSDGTNWVASTETYAVPGSANNIMASDGTNWTSSGTITTSSITFSPTTGGIVGTTAADNAAAGKVGEVISSVIASASAVSISNGVVKDMTSITLTAGDWDVWGNIFFTFTIGNGDTRAWTSTTSATKPDNSLISENNFVTGTSGLQGLNVPMLRYNVSGNTIVYISGYASFGSGTGSMCGGIYARRAR